MHDIIPLSKLRRKPDVDPQLAGFRFFLLTAQPGDWFTYHTGFLMNDRAVPDVDANRQDPDPVARQKAEHEDAGKDDPWFPVMRIKAVDQKAREVWNAYEAHEVDLFQRRLGPSTWAYMAQRRGKTRSAFEELS